MLLLLISQMKQAIGPSQDQEDALFWQNKRPIALSQDFEFAFHQIDSLNKLHPYNDKFWKRYKMTKEPSITSTTTVSSTTLKALSDNLLLPFTGKKETKHFQFIYTALDTALVDEIAINLEDNYSRILIELDVKNQPKVEVTIYPSIRAYHLSINNPDAPPYEIGSATGNSAFRIVSPNNPGPVWDKEFIMKAFIHEFTHCVHYTILEGLLAKELVALSPDDEQGTWLFEALACYQARQFFPPSG